MSDLLVPTRRIDRVGESHNVLIGAIDIAHAPDHLVSVLGSCIALVLFDPFAGMAGMAHVLLPDSRGDRTSTPGKYADTAVPAVIHALVAHGAVRSRLQAQLAGGARMFGAASAAIDIGTANVRAVSAALAAANVPVAHLDVGGGHGRKAHFNIAEGRMTVHTLNQTAAVKPGARP
jgi:chemotaxis protein CheD